MPGNPDALSRIKRSKIIIKVHDNDYTVILYKKEAARRGCSFFLIMIPGVQESSTKCSSLCSMKNLLAKFRINCSDITVIDDLHIAPKSER